MSKIRVHAGDFPKVSCWVSGKNLVLATSTDPNEPAAPLESVVVLRDVIVKKLGAALGWGLVLGTLWSFPSLFGARDLAILGSVIGSSAGLIAGGWRREVTFRAVFEDGRRLLGTTTSRTFTKLQAACF